LKLVGTENLANNEVNCPIVTKLGSAALHLAAFANDKLVGIEQARKLDWHFFATAWRTLDLCGLSHIGRSGARITTAEVPEDDVPSEYINDNDEGKASRIAPLM
jgi:hypothetical protein